MHANLVSSAGFKAKLNQGESLMESETFVAGEGRCSCAKVDFPFYDRSVLSGDRCVDNPAFWAETLDQGQIGAVNLSPLHSCGQKRCTVGVFGKNQGAGGIAVQTVDTAVDKGYSLALVIMGHTISESIFIISHGRMDGSVSGFVQD